MDDLTSLDNEQHRHRNRGGKGQLWSYWGGNFDFKGETNNVSTTELSNSAYPLSQARIGQAVWIVGFGQKGGVKRLLGMGLAPGMKLMVISSQPSGSVIVALENQRIGLGAEMAQKILVREEPLINGNEQEKIMSTQSRVYLREMPVGTVGRVLGYEKARGGYKGKLLSMGLTPKTHFTVIRVAPLGDPVEIEVRGFNLSLRKQEADALIVETVEKKGN
jgi:ferrous iron transport protein A